MITIPGRAGRNCEGMTRREWLRIGGLAGIGGFGIGVPDQLASRALGSQGDRGLCFGRAKSCIVLFMFGAPAHQDTWDMKPHAPIEVRSEFRPIATTVPGTQICEHMPRLAQLAQRYTVGVSLWRIPMTHFSAWDANWPFGPPPGGEAPPSPDPGGGGNGDPSGGGGGSGGGGDNGGSNDDCPRGGSIIYCHRQVLAGTCPTSRRPDCLLSLLCRRWDSTQKVGAGETAVLLAFHGQHNPASQPSAPTQLSGGGPSR